MRATSAGSILGKVINEPGQMASCDAPLPDMATAVGDGPGVIIPNDSELLPVDNTNKKSSPSKHKYSSDIECGYAMMFVELGDSLGSDVEDLTNEYIETNGLAMSNTTQESIMSFLRSVKESRAIEGDTLASIFTDRIAAGVEILTPTLFADDINVANLIASGNVVFDGQATFTLPPLFNNNTAGFAVIKAGSRKVEVTFDTAYIATPVVSTAISFESDEIDDATADELFTAGIQSIVMNKSANGFTILINKNAPRDIRFSWSALLIKDAKIFEGTVPGLIIESPQPDPVPEVVVNPEPEPPNPDPIPDSGISEEPSSPEPIPDPGTGSE
jgi:hypothetical protein